MDKCLLRDIDRLFAKSGEKTKRGTYHASIFLFSHLFSTYNCVKYLWKLRGEQILKACGIYSEKIYKKIERILLAAAIFHDIGKANSQFQNTIKYAMKIAEGYIGKQLIRHEWISVLIISIPPIREELTKYLGGETEFHIFRSSIAGHHIKFNIDVPNYIAVNENLKTGDFQKEMEILLDHPEFSFIISEANKKLGTEVRVPRLSRKDRNSNFKDPDHTWYQSFEKYNKEMNLLAESITEEEKIIAVISRCMLMMADVLSSAFVDIRHKNGICKSAPKWVDRMFNNYPNPDLLKNIIREKLEGAPLRPFQRQITEFKGLSLCVMASTGEGKTAGVILWSASLNRKLIYILPTIATSENAFIDYFFDGDSKKSKGGADLFTSKYQSQIKRLVEDQQRDYTGNYKDRADRISSLRLATTPIAVATVDTIVGLMQNYKRSIYAFSEIVTSILVFDEMASYDERLFNEVLIFLKTFPGIPAVFMSATFKPSQIKALKECRPDLKVIKGDPEFSIAKKYTYFSGEKIGWKGFIEDSYKRGEKSIVIRNTVRRAMTHYCDLVESHPDWHIVLTHSRFKEKDRFDILRKTVADFKDKKPIILVSTQVVEVSFNISGLNMATDVCPVGSYLQRVGRSARFPNESGKILVDFDIDDDYGWLVYTKGIEGKAEIEKAKAFFKKLVHGKKYSSTDFYRIWQNLSKQDPELNRNIEYALFNMRVGTSYSLRDTGRTVDIILESDLAKALRISKKDGTEYYDRATVDEYSLRMDDYGNRITSNPEIQVHNFPTQYGLFVVPDNLVIYNDVLGASWANNPNYTGLYARLRGIKR